MSSLADSHLRSVHETGSGGSRRLIHPGCETTAGTSKDIPIRAPNTTRQWSPWHESQHGNTYETLRPEKDVSASGANGLERGTDHDSKRVTRRNWALEAKTWRKVCEEGNLGEAVKALDHLVQRGFYVDKSVFCGFLKKCTAEKNLDVGRRIHDLAVQSGQASTAFLANHIICMYASHGRVEEALQVFTKVPVPNRYLWASIILAHARHRQARKAIQLYQQMRQASVKPDNHIFVAVLKACATAKDVFLGRQVHADIQQSGEKPNLFTGNCLVDMYCKCGSLKEACKVFESLPSKDVVTWNSMMTGYVQHGLGEEALTLYGRMQQEAISRADAVTFLCLLQACVLIGALHQGKQLHIQIQDRGLEGDLVIGSCLVDMYAKCGSPEDARRLFDKLPIKDVVTWNAMISGYAQHGLGHEALSLYGSMHQEGITTPDAVTFVCVLQACAILGALHEGKQLHAEIERRRLGTDVVVGNCLVHLYAKCGSLKEARNVFDNLQTKDVVTWNSMIAGYAQHGLIEEALTLYETMQQEGKTEGDAFTFACLLQACGTVSGLKKGREIHDRIVKLGLEATDQFVGNALIDMYSKAGSIMEARKVFDKLPARDVGTWTAMIVGYTQHGLPQEALSLYSDMQEQGIIPVDAVSFVGLLQACASSGALHQGKQLHVQLQEKGLETDIVVGTCLVNMYAKCGKPQHARRVFDQLPRKNLVTWTAMLAGYTQHGLGHHALNLYQTMQGEGISPLNVVTYLCLLQACGSVAGLEKGKEIHSQVFQLELESSTDLLVRNAVIDMYGKCGSPVDAEQVFDAMPTRDVVTWNALIAGYVRQGDSDVVFNSFQRMMQEDVQPDIITFLNILTVCSHVGLVVEAEKYFGIMSRDYGITPSIQHYSTMIDLLGRAGEVERSMDMIRTMPFKPDSVLWRSILGACRKCGNVELGRRAFECAVRLDKSDAAAYVLMSNIYAAAHMQEEAKKMQAMRVKARAWKQPGQSWWSDMGGYVHVFAVGDKSHPEWRSIDAKLKYLFVKMKKEGYVPHLDSVLRDMPDDEKEAALCGHSEKLAIAYALHKTPEGTTIRVAKNLRVCEDCHKAAALISKIEERTIICRDASRFHVYKHGKCSCGDYW